jgi:hypothetical protein
VVSRRRRRRQPSSSALSSVWSCPRRLRSTVTEPRTTTSGPKRTSPTTLSRSHATTEGRPCWELGIEVRQQSVEAGSSSSIGGRSQRGRASSTWPSSARRALGRLRAHASEWAQSLLHGRQPPPRPPEQVSDFLVGRLREMLVPEADCAEPSPGVCRQTRSSASAPSARQTCESGTATTACWGRPADGPDRRQYGCPGREAAPTRMTVQPPRSSGGRSPRWVRSRRSSSRRSVASIASSGPAGAPSCSITYLLRTAHATGRDRAEGVPLVTRNPWLAHEEHVERRVQSRRDLKRDRSPATPREPEHDEVVPRYSPSRSARNWPASVLCVKCRMSTTRCS